MSGRRGGRGRGRGGKSFGNLEALGLSSGDSLPPPILQPPPLYPPMERPPLELSATEADEDILFYKQNLRHWMRSSPFYIKSEKAANFEDESIERYRDKYKNTDTNDLSLFVRSIPDWSVVPQELHINVATTKKKDKALRAKRAAKHSLAKSKASTGDQVVEGGEVSKHLDQLEKDEQTGSEGEGTGGETEEEYDEEVEEEEGDYQQTYFDPGDEYAADEDDALEEDPSY